jgi:hypothetical protein
MGGKSMSEKRRTTVEEAKRVGDEIGVDWSRFDLEQFRQGMDVEFEHGSHDPQTDVTHDDPIVTGKIALAHMKAQRPVTVFEICSAGLSDYFVEALASADPRRRSRLGRVGGPEVHVNPPTVV